MPNEILSAITALADYFRNDQEALNALDILRRKANGNGANGENVPVPADAPQDPPEGPGGD